MLCTGVKNCLPVATRPVSCKTPQLRVTNSKVQLLQQGRTECGLLTRKLNIGGQQKVRKSKVVKVVAQLTARGRRIEACEVVPKRTLGQGSFGEVFEGVLTNGHGEETVVLKRVKNRVKGAQEMSEMEHLLNVYVSRAAKGSCADFLGYCEVDKGTSGKLTSGLWLVWKYEGKHTLDYYLRRRDCVSAIAADLGIDEDHVVPFVLRQLLQNVKQLHQAGLVHRDVKPANIILNEAEQRFKLIDLGACADLRTGTNYIPTESILDPNYCPPEQYVLPTDTPHLALHVTPLAMMMSPMLWMKHRPDRFDMFSIGLILLQLAIPSLRSRDKLRQFREELQTCRYNIRRWRATSFGRTCASPILEANNEAGWNLVESLLKPRKTINLENGDVQFVGTPDEMRPSAEQALKSEFIQQVKDVVVGSTVSREVGAVQLSGVETNSNVILSLWQNVSEKLFSLEAEISYKSSATQQQSLRVEELQQQVEQGVASREQLQKEESKLTVLTSQLKQLTDEFSTTSSWIGRIFGVGSASTSVQLPTVPGDENLEEKKQSGAVKVANQLVESSLSFTGIAAKVAGRVARVLKDDTEKVIQKLQEEQRRSKRKQDLEEQFLEMVAECKLYANSNNNIGEYEWEDVEPIVCNDPRFAAVNQERREALFAIFIEARKEKYEAAVRKAEKEIMEILKFRVQSSSMQYQSISSYLQQMEAAQFVGEERRQALFDLYITEVKSKEEQRKRQRETEMEFKLALENLQPPITGQSNWPHVKRLLWSHSSSQTLSDATRKTLFEEYRQIMRDLEEEQMQHQSSHFQAAGSFIPILADEGQESQEQEQVQEITESATSKVKKLEQEKAQSMKQFEQLQAQLQQFQQQLADQQQLIARLQNNKEESTC